jgi:hypothetical protein
MNRIVESIRVYDRRTKGYISIDVDVEVDVRALAEQLAVKAYSNKSGKTSLAFGKVRVSVRGPSKT